MGLARFLALIFLAGWLGLGPASAERRLALVIGNSAYTTVPRLANPANDAALVGDMLRKAGFDAVDVKLDLNVVEMRRALREFAAKVREADVAVVYYAGHGIEVDGTNYLIPTDAALETDTDVFDEAFALDRILLAVEPARQLRLVILDACRDNPFAKAMKRSVATRAIGRGLAKVEPTSPNTMIAFAAKAGSTASDGDAKNSPFAAALVERLPTPGLDLRKAFGFVRDDVLKKTGYKQEPYVYGSLGGNDVPLIAAKPVIASPQPGVQDVVLKDYELALQIGTREIWSAFLVRHPDGFYASLAKGQLNRLAAEEARAAAEKAKPADQPKSEMAEQRRKETEAAANTNKPAAEKVVIEPVASKGSDPVSVVGGEQKVAALPPAPPGLPSQEVVKMVQSELRRLGCLTSASDRWDAESQRSLARFNKAAGTKFEVKAASADVLDVLRTRQGRVCRLVCEQGFRADGENCVKIVCKAGYRINGDNECEKVQDKKPAIAREDGKARDENRKQKESPPSKPQASGQILCNQAGCRPVRPGCRIARTGLLGRMEQNEVCP